MDLNVHYWQSKIKQKLRYSIWRKPSFPFFQNLCSKLHSIMKTFQKVKRISRLDQLSFTFTVKECWFK
jgi:hypothetical protein